MQYMNIIKSTSLIVLGVFITVLVGTLLRKYQSLEFIFGVMVGIATLLTIILTAIKIFNSHINSSAIRRVKGLAIDTVQNYAGGRYEDWAISFEFLVKHLKLIIVSFSMFGVFTIVLSFSLYYAAFMQVEKLDNQNLLICAQNQLTRQTNAISSYQIKKIGIENSSEAMSELRDSIVAPLRKVKSCSNRYGSSEIAECFLKIEPTYKEIIRAYESGRSSAYSVQNKYEEPMAHYEDLIESFRNVEYTFNHQDIIFENSYSEGTFGKRKVITHREIEDYNSEFYSSAKNIMKSLGEHIQMSKEDLIEANSDLFSVLNESDCYDSSVN